MVGGWLGLVGEDARRVDPTRATASAAGFLSDDVVHIGAAVCRADRVVVAGDLLVAHFADVVPDLAVVAGARAGGVDWGRPERRVDCAGTDVKVLSD